MKMDCLLRQSISKTDYSEGKHIFRLKKTDVEGMAKKC